MIVLVRHGETEGNATRVLQLPDIPLNARGIRQAERVAERLWALGVARIVSSDLLRARMTAEAIAAKVGLPIETSALLQERNFGDLRGIPYSQLNENPFAPELVPPNGESWAAFHDRVARAFELICTWSERTDGNLVVVTHGLVCRALGERHAAWAGIVPDRFHNTSVTLIDPKAPYSVQLGNCCAHLGAEDTDGTRETGAV
jgi:probable phosphoglycerate mutase